MGNWQHFSTEFVSYAQYLWREIGNPHWGNYFYWLIAISLFTFALELTLPWRKNQKRFRKDFWLDVFYMFFNFFIFSLVGYHAATEVLVHWFQTALATVGIENTVALKVSSLPVLAQLGLMLLLRDFIHFNVHRLLHRVPWLWEFHKVHHSVKEMGFAAHLRFHWMETVVYRTLEYLPLALIGFGIDDFLWVHLFSLFIGHINHANLGWDYGWLKYVFNNPKMHIWHHAKHLPAGKTGVNFGLTFSFWDYLFKTNYIPHDGRDIELGFESDEAFPKGFFRQITYPLKKSNPK